MINLDKNLHHVVFEITNHKILTQDFSSEEMINEVSMKVNNNYICYNFLGSLISKNKKVRTRFEVSVYGINPLKDENYKYILEHLFKLNDKGMIQHKWFKRVQIEQYYEKLF